MEGEHMRITRLTKVATASMALWMLLSGAAPALPDSIPAPSASIQTSQYIKAPAGTTEAENENFHLKYDPADGTYIVIDKRGGFYWHSCPPGREEDTVAAGKYKMNLFSAFGITYADPETGVVSTSNSYTASVRKNGLSVTPLENGFKAVYNFPSEQFTVSLYVTLDSKGIRCEIPLSEIREEGQYLLYRIDLQPYFGAAGSREDGYLLVPDGCGALIRFNNGRHSYDQYEQRMYGRDLVFDIAQDKAVTQTARLPVFGIRRQTDEGDAGLTGIITEGDARATLIADVAGQRTSYNTVYPSFEVRGIDTYAMGQGSGINVKVVNMFDRSLLPDELLTVEYRLLAGEDGQYPGMAAAYREYLIQNGLERRTEPASDLHLELLGGARKKKPFLGIPMERDISVTGYNNALAIMEDLKVAGLENILIQYDNWSDQSIRGKAPTGATASDVLGGSGALKKLIFSVQEMEYKLCFGLNVSSVQKWGGGLSKGNAGVKTVSQTPAVRYSYDRATFFKTGTAPWYLITPRRYEDIVNRFIGGAEKWAISGIVVEETASVLYADFTSRKKISRQAASERAGNAVRLLRTSGYTVAVDGGNAYTLPYADAVINAPSSSSQYDIANESVPFYQLALHGYLEMSGDPVNLSDSPVNQLLKAAETGSALHFYLADTAGEALIGTVYSDFYSIGYTEWRDTAVAYAARLQSLNRETFDRTIIGHRCVEKGVFETTYDNGVRVLVNYNDRPVTVDNLVVQAQDFTVAE